MTKRGFSVRHYLNLSQLFVQMKKLPLNSDQMPRTLPALAIRRPITIVMIFLSTLVVGMVAWNDISIQLLPGGLDPPFLWIWLSYPNSSPVENMERIGQPVEEAFWTIKGIKNVRTRARDNGCSVFLEFNQSVDMDVAYLAIRDRLERVRPELPDDYRYTHIRRFSEDDEPVLYFGISITGNYDDPYRMVEEEVVRPLERVDGVASVEMWGGDAKMIRIELLVNRLKAYGIDIADVMSRLRSENFAIAGGKVKAADRELLVRADGRIKSLEELERLPVKGTAVVLGDIADISYSSPPRRWIQRIGRKDAIQMGVFKESDANAVEVTERLAAVIDDITANPRMQGFDFNILFDQGNIITQSVKNLEEAGMWGAIFAVLVLFFFLRRFRMTLFITMAIPISVLIAVICLYFMDWSLNIITLSGLMICVGLVVDNAIVVVENIFTYKQKGVSSTEAAIKGASEVGLAITLATLTTVVVFLPLMLMSSDRILAFYLLRIGLPVIYALLASLMVALLFIPLAVNKFALEGKSRTSPLIEKSSVRIRAVAAKVLKHRGESVLILLIILMSTGIPMKGVISTDEEESNINDFALRFHFPPYYSLARVDSLLKSYEDTLYANAKAYDIKTVVTGFQRGHGRLRVFMNEVPERTWFTEGFIRIARRSGLYKPEVLERKEVIEDIKEKIEIPPGVEMHSTWRRGSGDEDAVYVSVYGENIHRLLEITEDVKRRLEGLEGVLSLETDLETSSDEVQIRYDPALTSLHGVDPAQAAYGLNALVRGVELSRVHFDGHEIEARAELRESDRATLSQVMALPASGQQRNRVSLGDIADVGYDRGIGEITRENGRTRIRVKLTTTEDNLEDLRKKIDSALSSINLPPGYEWGKGRRFQAIEDATRERSQAWLLAITFVFLLMGALFESFLLPWVVIATIPFSFFGVWWMLFITGTQFGIMAGIGVVILIGVVVNNAIVLVDRINRLRSEGMPRDEALVTAVQQRFRPIAMTALTTIMGLMPMAVGSANMIGIPYSPMGRAIIGGMIAATISTPIVVPLMYSLADDFKQWLKSYFTALRNG